MKLQDYIHYYWHCKMQFRPQHNSEYLFYGFIKELPRNGTEVLMHVIEDNIGETPDNNVCYAFCPDIKLILRKLESLTKDEMKECGNLVYDFSNDPYLNEWHWENFAVVLCAEQFDWLLKRGFDLFGLIDAGLAIDSKTLK